MSILLLDGLRGGAIDRRAERNLRMVGRQRDSDDGAGGCLDDLTRFLVAVAGNEPQPIDREPVRLAEDGQVDLQAVVSLQGPAGAKKQVLVVLGSGDRVHVADRRAAMANRVAVGDFLVLMGWHE